MDHSVDELIYALKERAKELNCLYEVEGLFRKPNATLVSILEGIVRAIRPLQSRFLFQLARTVSKSSRFDVSLHV